MNPYTEQEAWEEHQIGKAMLKYGSKNKKQVSDVHPFVFEGQIDFIKASVMDGYKFDNEEIEDSLEKSRAKSALEALQVSTMETRQFCRCLQWGHVNFIGVRDGDVSNLCGHGLSNCPLLKSVRLKVTAVPCHVLAT